MKPYKFPSSGNCSPRSPPASPRPRSRSPRYRNRAGKSVRPPSKSLVHRLGWLLLSLLLKRQGLFLFAPLLYLSVMLFYMGTVSYDIAPVSKLRHLPGSVYRSPQLYAKLRSEMDSDNSSVDAVSYYSYCCNSHVLFSYLFRSLLPQLQFDSTFFFTILLYCCCDFWLKSICLFFFSFTISISPMFWQLLLAV